jgi:glycosyltransferase involved in cell wall biosynthesis
LRGLDIPLVLSVRDYGYSCALRTLMRGDEVCSGPGVAKCLTCAAGHYGWPKAAGAVAGVLGGRALLARKTSAIHCVSEFVETVMRRDFVREQGTDAEHRTVQSVTIPDIVVIPEITDPNGSRLNEIGPKAVMLDLPDEPFILFVGALQLHKGLQPLLAAYQQLESPPPMVLIGSVWPDTPGSFPPGVTVLRNLPHADVMYAWQHSLFGMVPSIWPDPLPGTVREAMSQGKAVIGSATGGIVDMIVPGVTGLLVPPGDVAALRSAMALLIGDGELRDRLGAAARERAARYAADEVAPSFERLYAQLLAGTAST